MKVGAGRIVIGSDHTGCRCVLVSLALERRAKLTPSPHPPLPHPLSLRFASRCLPPACISELRKMLGEVSFDDQGDGRGSANKESVAGRPAVHDSSSSDDEGYCVHEYGPEILSAYQPLHLDPYYIHPTTFFVPSFVKAIKENTEESLRSTIQEVSPGIYTFSMLQPSFCEMFLAEVEHFEKWAQEENICVMRPNSMNNYGLILDHIGMEPMLSKLMDDFVSPLSRVLFPEVGGSSLDSHHGFIVEYGKGKDRDLGFHVDDSEVTLNVCLGKQFSGGELFFRGVRCDEHVNSEALPQEIFDYSHLLGQAILHQGRHRHGARCTTSGDRTNLILWCRSSTFRKQMDYRNDFSSWCGECARLGKHRQ